MKYKKSNRRQVKEYENDLVNYWKKNKIFEKSVDTRPKNKAFVFYDGPPFITGSPHYGTLLSSIVKDAIARFYTMQGKRVERVWGWDCHGLPAEIFTEEKLGIKDRRDIGTKVSLEKYINTCRENMILTGNEWEDVVDRIGRWVDFKGAYKTMDKDYMESVWWAFKELYSAGKIYEGEKVLLYCIRDATPVSKAEVAMDNSYKDVTDPSVYIKFKLTDSDYSLLVWTTTPWTLIANTAIAINKGLDYSEVQLNSEKIIIAKKLIEKVLVDEKGNSLDYKIHKTFKGMELVGKKYQPLFKDRGFNAHKIWDGSFVTTEEGTGIVHIAPAYGEDDFDLANENQIPIVHVIDDVGLYTEGEWKGKQVWQVNKDIAKQLLKKNIALKIDYYQHSYPHCHRCGTRLMYRAHPSWFLNISDQKELMLEQNGSINWFPQHIKHGRFAKTIESAPDWNISRDRFWATAMPVWKGTDKDGSEQIKVIGSYKELEELSGKVLEDYHRPWIDDITFTHDGIKYKRIDKVLDCWFESGSMPFAQFHYPFENTAKFENNFPGDFIAEYVGQVRAWFYYLHAVSIGLFNRNSFNNVIVTGTLSGNDGRKMSKSFGNYTDPNELLDKFGADSLRFLLLSSPLLNGEDFSLVDKDVADVNRKLNMIWNVYDFFCLYAEVDGWDSELKNGELPADPSLKLKNQLDIWIVSRVHMLNKEISKHINNYDVPNALKSVLPFIDDLSNWYVRRSRRRFWKSQNDNDKNYAYKTLHYALVHFSLLIAPFLPFLSEELYRQLIKGESIHLLNWPEPGNINEMAVEKMEYIRKVINDGLAQRATSSIKVRQPLQSISIKGAPLFFDAIEEDYLQIIKDELNIKEILVNTKDKEHLVSIDTLINEDLKKEGLMREFIRLIQQQRKNNDFNVDDRIILSIYTTDKSLEVIIKDNKYVDVIKNETLTKELNLIKKPEKFNIKVSGIDAYINLQKINK